MTVILDELTQGTFYPRGVLSKAKSEIRTACLRLAMTSVKRDKFASPSFELAKQTHLLILGHSLTFFEESGGASNIDPYRQGRQACWLIIGGLRCLPPVVATKSL